RDFPKHAEHEEGKGSAGDDLEPALPGRERRIARHGERFRTSNHRVLTPMSTDKLDDRVALRNLASDPRAPSLRAIRLIVMAGLAPAIHVFIAARKTWMPGTRPGMTEEKPSQPNRTML